MEIDAIDNGVAQTKKNADPLVYKIQTGLSSRVARLNPAWNAEDVDPSEQFKKALEIAE